MSESEAQKSCDVFLERYRKCPDDSLHALDKWRTILWTSALNQDSQHLADEIYRAWKRIRFTYLTFDSKVIVLLRTLRQRYKIGLITNGPSCAQWEKISTLKAEQLFDTVLVSGDLTCEKPQAEIFHLACRKLQVRPEKCVMVGDRFDTDILGGELAGLAASVWIPLNAEEEQADEHKLTQSSSPIIKISHVLQLADLFALV